MPPGVPTFVLNLVLRLKAGVSKADQADPDSTVGNGNLEKGEAGEALVDLRVFC